MLKTLTLRSIEMGPLFEFLTEELSKRLQSAQSFIREAFLGKRSMLENRRARVRVRSDFELSAPTAHRAVLPDVVGSLTRPRRGAPRLGRKF